jgi:hypothetical protein
MESCGSHKTNEIFKSLNNETMKELLTIIMLCGVCYGYAQDTPPYAASTQTWEVEADDATYIWSDYINLPECNKPDGKDCNRGEGIYNEYSWKFLQKNAGKLCPDPWTPQQLMDHPLLNDQLWLKTTLDFKNLYKYVYLPYDNEIVLANHRVSNWDQDSRTYVRCHVEHHSRLLCKAVDYKYIKHTTVPTRCVKKT